MIFTVGQTNVNIQKLIRKIQIEMIKKTNNYQKVGEEIQILW